MLSSGQRDLSLDSARLRQFGPPRDSGRPRSRSARSPFAAFRASNPCPARHTRFQSQTATMMDPRRLRPRDPRSLPRGVSNGAKFRCPLRIPRRQNPIGSECGTRIEIAGPGRRLAFGIAIREVHHYGLPARPLVEGLKLFNFAADRSTANPVGRRPLRTRLKAHYLAFPGSAMWNRTSFCGALFMSSSLTRP